jgi:rhamnosyl/mannosyltransferase
MPRLKVVHAAKFYPPVHGGMETVVRDLCDGTADQWDVSVVAANTRRRTDADRVGSVDVLRVASLGTLSSVPLCPSFAVHLWASEADCLVLHEPNPIAGASLYFRQPARSLIIWHHSDLVRPWWAPLTYGRIQRALYRRADCVVVSSPTLAASSSLVPHARRVEMIPFGIELERFLADDARTRREAQMLRGQSAGPRVLFVGRFVYYKGVHVLLDAIARASGTLVLVGEGPLEPALRARVAELRLGDRVVFAGRVPEADLPRWYRSCDLFVLPSVARTEAFGVVQVEAMAAGLPVVSTDLPTGVPWVNQDGVTGFVVAPGDAAALARAITRLAGDADLRTRLGSQARRRAEAMFDRSRMIRAFRDVVESVAHAARREPTLSAGAEAAL